MAIWPNTTREARFTEEGDELERPIRSDAGVVADKIILAMDDMFVMAWCESCSNGWLWCAAMKKPIDDILWWTTFLALCVIVFRQLFEIYLHGVFA